MAAEETAHRAAVIGGLRELADFLETHPEAPVPLYSADVHVSTHGTDHENEQTVNRAAMALGTTASWGTGPKTHYRVKRMFGAVEYSVTAITRASMAQYHADQSYSGCVQPADEPADVAAMAA
jgi:hypothetical protein